VVVGESSPKKRKNIDVKCAIEKYLMKNMKSLIGFVGVVEESHSNEDFLQQKVFLRFDLTASRFL
jgi:hypothetical protein